MDKNLTSNVKLYEVFRSETAIRNNIDNTTKDERVLINLRSICLLIFEPIRALLGGRPIMISSGYRSKELNKLLGGSNDSQHCKGEALDLVATHCSNWQLFDAIKNRGVFDQLIAEDLQDGSIKWVHVSFKEGTNNRKEVLVMRKNKLKKGDLDKNGKKVTKAITETIYEAYDQEKHRQ